MKSMKRWLAVLTAVCSMASICPLSASAEVDADVNHDGVVSYIDLVLVKKKILGLYTYSYDANGDGTSNVLDINIVKNALLYGKAVVTTTQATTQANVQNNSSGGLTLTDGHGNTYSSLDGYSLDSKNGIVYKWEHSGSETAQNYAAAVEAYYGIEMVAKGNSVWPACYADLDATGSLEELNAWRAGRTPAEIGVVEIVNHWNLILNDLNFYASCKNYLASLDLSRSFPSTSDAISG